MSVTAAPNETPLRPTDAPEIKPEKVRGAGVRIAFTAALIQLALIAGFGNEQFGKYYADHASKGVLGQLTDPLVINWWRINGVADDVRIALAVSAASVVVMVFLFCLLVGWSAASPRPAWATFFGVWGALIVANAIGGGIRAFWMYGATFDGKNAPEPYNDKFGWAVHELQLSASPGLLYGWVIALVCAAMASGKYRSTVRRAAIAQAQADADAAADRERMERAGSQVHIPGDPGYAGYGYAGSPAIAGYAANPMGGSEAPPAPGGWASAGQPVEQPTTVHAPDTRTEVYGRPVDEQTGAAPAYPPPADPAAAPPVDPATGVIQMPDETERPPNPSDEFRRPTLGSS